MVVEYEEKTILIITKAFVNPPSPDDKIEEYDEDSKAITWAAVWDTGTSDTIISSRIVEMLQLSPLSQKEVIEAIGANEYTAENDIGENTPRYLVDIYLHAGTAKGMIVTALDKDDMIGADIYIGMDIIGQGDFAISNFGGKTQMTFRLPSKEKVDFTQE